MRTGEIKALSGLRIVAALWVVLFHFRPLLWAAAPSMASALRPILDRGAQGVDLFFILSGFVITLNYLDKMGPTWSTRATVRFLWLRLARVWPVYLVTLHLAAAWIIFTLYVGHVPSKAVDTLNATSYLRQLLLVQLWYQPFFDGSSWDGPAWSISAEWLAYLLFGVLALVVFRIARVTRARSLMWLAFAATLPPLVLLLASGHLYTPWSWLPRIIMQFTAGALACAALRKVQLSDRSRLGAGYLSVVLVGVAVGGLYWFDAHPQAWLYDAGGLVDVLFLPVVVTLAVGAGSLPWVLSLRPMVYLGQVSFSLYMVHELVHTAWLWVGEQFALIPTENMWKLIVLTLFAIAFGASVLLFHFVEEPARRWMRRMADAGGAKPTARLDRPAETALAPVHLARADESQPRARRAM